jgi:hypothetical protein
MAVMYLALVVLVAVPMALLSRLLPRRPNEPGAVVWLTIPVIYELAALLVFVPLSCRTHDRGAALVGGIEAAIRQDGSEACPVS